MQNAIIRPAILNDLPQLTEIHNYYVLNTHITFDVQPFEPHQRAAWFTSHSGARRYQMFVAEDSDQRILGYACTGRFRDKAAYDTTVESSVACRPDATGKGLGKRLYAALFDSLSGEDIHRIVAGVAQPNSASNALHMRFGFETIGTFQEVGRKFDRYWDVTWMERPLILPKSG